MKRRLRSLTVYGHLARHRPAMTLAVALLAVVANLFEGLALVILIPLISGVTSGDFGGDNRLSEFVVDALAAVGIRPTLLSVIGVFAVLGATSSVSVFATTVVAKKVMNDAEARLRSLLFADVFSMRWEALATSVAGQLTKIFIQGTQFGAYGFYYLLFGLTMAIAASVYLAFSFLLSPRMTVMTLCFGAAVTPIFLLISREGKRSSTRASAAFEQLTGHLHDAITNPKFMLAQDLTSFLGERYHADVDRYRVERNKNDRQSALMRMAFEGMAVAFVGVYLYVSLRVLEQPIGVALVFLAVFYRLGPRIIGVQENLFRAISHATWLEDVLALSEQAREAVPSSRGTAVPTFERELEVSDVRFAYAGAEGGVLNGASIRIAPSECVAVVGPSGQGKTTLLDVVTGLLSPDSGTVRLDGVDLSTIDMSAWRSRVGFVLQDSPVFNATIRDNIVLDRAFDADRFAETCRVAGVSEFVERLPGGYDTAVGERGSQISGGQRQRIALARALYRQPWLLILDEATNSLDATTEDFIIDRLADLKGSLAMLVVTHGSRLLRLADRTYRIERGITTEVLPQGAQER